jgi:hypothetical protein
MNYADTLNVEISLNHHIQQGKTLIGWQVSLTFCLENRGRRAELTRMDVSESPMDFKDVVKEEKC